MSVNRPNSRYRREMQSVTLSAVTTLTFLILLEGLLDDKMKQMMAPYIVAFAASEVILDIFVISPDQDKAGRTVVSHPVEG